MLTGRAAGALAAGGTVRALATPDAALKQTA